MAPPPRPQLGTAADINIAGTLPMHITGLDSARSKHGALARRKYSLLAPPGMAVDPSGVGDQESGDDHGATGEAVNQARRDTEEGGETQQRAFPVHSI